MLLGLNVLDMAPMPQNVKCLSSENPVTLAHSRIVTPRASYQIHNIAGCACTGNAGTFSRRWLQSKPLVNDPGMHHGTCVTHAPWCMSGSLSLRGKFSRHSRRMRTHNFTYLARGPLNRIYSMLVHIKDSCLTTPSHNLEQCWLIISGVPCHM